MASRAALQVRDHPRQLGQVLGLRGRDVLEPLALAHQQLGQRKAAETLLPDRVAAQVGRHSQQLVHELPQLDLRLRHA